MEYENRLEEIAAVAASLVRLRLANEVELATAIPRVTFRWTLSVSLERDPETAGALPPDALLPEVIKTVRFGLPKTCRLLKCGTREMDRVAPDTPYIDVDAAPFEVTATSWFPFTVPIVVIWKDYACQPPLRLDHDLDFHAEGSSWSYNVDLKEAFAARTAGAGGATASEAPPHGAAAEQLRGPPGQQAPGDVVVTEAAVPVPQSCACAFPQRLVSLGSLLRPRSLVGSRGTSSPEWSTT